MWCKSCGYDLTGLDPFGNCPECALAIERSLTDDRLANASPAYLARLHSGAFWIQTGIVVIILNIFVAMGIGMAAQMLGLSNLAATATVLLGSLVASVMIAAGWWRFTEPDPSFTGRADASTARVWVRAATLGSLGATLLNAGVQTFTAAPELVMFTTIVYYVAFVIQYFASMVYLRWLTPRIPNWRAFRRSKTLMWLGPVLAIPGACVLVGPLVALVLYWNMLDWIRKDLKAIRAAAPAS